MDISSTFCRHLREYYERFLDIGKLTWRNHLISGRFRPKEIEKHLPLDTAALEFQHQRMWIRKFMRLQ